MKEQANPVFSEDANPFPPEHLMSNKTNILVLNI